MTNLRPVHAEAYKRWHGRITATDQTSRSMNNIPGLFMFNVRALLKAYYGSIPRALWSIGLSDLDIWIHVQWHSFLIMICDYVGWSKIYHYPATDEMIEHYQRHGWKCSGSPNCENMDCITDSVPKWFKKLTRWED